MKTEFEVKFLDFDLQSTQTALSENGFTCTSPNHLTKRRVYHLKNSTERKWFRVRDEGGRITLTAKQSFDDKEIFPNEAEVTVSNFDETCIILEIAGLVFISYQEVFRETWEKNDIEVCIDTWPMIGSVLEIEAQNETELKNYSAILGFDYSKGFLGSMDQIFLLKTGKRASEISNLVF